MAANPHIPVFQVREGHTQLNHSYTAPCVAGHGGVWQAQASDPIPIR